MYNLEEPIVEMQFDFGTAPIDIEHALCGSALEKAFQIGRILHLKSEIRNIGLDAPASRRVQFAISDFGFEMQDSSDFEISEKLNSCSQTVYDASGIPEEEQ
jgi:hypothetical protein